MTESAGYSGTPLVRKLGPKEGMRVSLLGSPDEDVDFLHLFATHRDTLEERFRAARDAMAQEGMVWASWPKKSSGVESEVALYTDDPLYLPGRGPVVEGRRGLRSQFAFLERIRADSRRARISFESVDRGSSGELAWDAGYYALRVEHADGSRSDPSRGECNTVWRRDDAGAWRIHVDAFSPTPPRSASL